jgi:hypothetical protein
MKTLGLPWQATGPLSRLRRVVQLLKNLGQEVLTRHLVQDNAGEVNRQIRAQGIYRRDTAWLDQCGLFIAGVSGSSFWLGFETGYFLGATNKKAISSISQGDSKKNITPGQRSFW